MNCGEAKPAETRPRPLPAGVPMRSRRGSSFEPSAIPSVPRRLVNILAFARLINSLCDLIRSNPLLIILRQWGKVAFSDD